MGGDQSQDMDEKGVHLAWGTIYDTAWWLLGWLGTSSGGVVWSTIHIVLVIYAVRGLEKVVEWLQWGVNKVVQILFFAAVLAAMYVILTRHDVTAAAAASPPPPPPSWFQKLIAR